MPFYFNKDNLPPVLVVFCKEDYHVCSLVSGNRLKFIKKKKKNHHQNGLKWAGLNKMEHMDRTGPKQTELTEMSRMDRNSLNGPKCYVNVAQIRA